MVESSRVLNRKSWYLSALYLPVVLPIILLLARWSAALVGLKAAGLDELVASAIVPLAFGGIQYLVFCLLVGPWLRKKTTREIQLISWILPPLFIPICCAGIFIYSLTISYLQRAWRPVGAPDLRFVLSFWQPVIYVGYAYVLLAHALAFALGSMRLFRD